MRAAITPSSGCITTLCELEGLRESAYRDGGGVWTIGYGHTRDVNPGDTCTEAEARAWMEEDDVKEAAAAVNRLVTAELTQNQFDALTLFVYNVGAGSLEHSTLLKKLNGGDRLGAAGQFLQWTKINGLISHGLMNRRLAERDLFMKPEEVCT